MYLKDPTEILEDRMERNEQLLEIRGDTFKCPECGKRAKLADAQSTGPDPAAMPVCRECLPL